MTDISTIKLLLLPQAVFFAGACLGAVIFCVVKIVNRLLAVASAVTFELEIRRAIMVRSARCGKGRKNLCIVAARALLCG
jgi:hypothetical protein